MPRAVYAEWDEDDVAEWVDERPARRLRRRPLPWLRIVLMSSCSIAGLVYFALEQEQNPAPGRACESRSRRRPGRSRPGLDAAAAPRPRSIRLPMPPVPVASEARQHADGAREDSLVLGRFGDARYAQLALTQGTAETAGSFYIDTRPPGAPARASRWRIRARAG